MIARPARELGKRAPWLHEGGLTDIAFARDGRILTVGTRSVRTWMAATGELAAETERGPRDGRLQSGILSPLSDRWIAVAYLEQRQELRIWNLATGAYQGEITLPDESRYITRFSADGTRVLLSMSDDGRFQKIFSIEEGRFIGSLDTGAVVEGVARPNLALAFLPDGTVMGCDPDGAIRRWDGNAPLGRVVVPALLREEGNDLNLVSEIHGAPAGTLFAAVYYDGVRVYDVDGKKRQEMKEFYSPLAFSRDGERIVLRDHKSLSVFDASGARLQSWSLEALSPSRVAIRGDGRWVAFGMDDGAFATREVGATTAPVASERRRDVLPGAVMSLRTTPDGAAFLLGCSDGSLLSWRLGAETPVRLPAHGNESYAIARPDGTIVSCGATILRRYAPDGTLEMECAAAEGRPGWSPDGSHVVFLSPKRAAILDTTTGQARDVLLPDAPDRKGQFFREEVALSNSGRMALMIREGLWVFEPDGRLLHSHLFAKVLESNVWTSMSLAFVSDDVLAWGDSVRGGGLFLVETGELVVAGTEGLSVVAVDSSRGRVAFQRGTGIALYDASGREWLAELDSPDYCVVAFLPDGRQVATASADRRIIIWEID